MSIQVCPRSTLSFAGICALSTFAAAGNVSIVDDSGGADFTDMQAAVNAAADGDTILVRPGTYGDLVIDDKAVNVIAETGGVNFVGTIYVSNLSRQKRVVFSGVTATGRAVYPISEPALVLYVNVGAIRFQNCTIKGGAGTPLPPGLDCFDLEPYGAGGLAADLFHCTDLSFADSSIVGGNGFGTTQPPCHDSDGGFGGIGLKARNSQVALYDCTVRGGRGGNTLDSHAGDGGIACQIPTGGLLASGTSFYGGNGGDTKYDWSKPQAGNGGHGILVGGGGNVHLLDGTHAGGAAGINLSGGILGVPGMGLTGTGVIDQLTGTRRKCTAAPIAAPSSSLTVTIVGAPGDQVFLPWSPRSFWRYRPAHHGTWLIPYPARMTAQPIGVIPGTGTLTTQIPLAALPAGSEAELTCIQGFIVDTSGNTYLGSPMHVLRK